MYALTTLDHKVSCSEESFFFSYFFLSTKEILLNGKILGVILLREENQPDIAQDGIEQKRRKYSTGFRPGG